MCIKAFLVCALGICGYSNVVQIVAGGLCPHCYLVVFFLGPSWFEVGQTLFAVLLHHAKKNLRYLHRLFCFLFDGVAGAMGGRKAVRLDLVRCLSCPPLHPRGGTGHGITGHLWAAGAQKHSNEAILPLTTIPVGQGVPREGEGMELKSQA